MHTSDPGDGTPLPPIVVVAPYRDDALVLTRALAEAGLESRVAADADALRLALPEASCLLIAQEGLTPDVMTEVDAVLERQPDWSELPVLVFAAKSADAFALERQLAERWPSAKLVFYARPLSPVELMSGVQLALSARGRQLRLRDQLAQEVELRRELNHRVKNILTSVQAMARMTRRRAGSREALFDDFEARLGSLSTVHAMLHEARDGGVDFPRLADGVLRPYGEGDGSRFRIGGTAAPLEAEAAKGLALCLHELATNALKYGALSRSRGTVEVELRRVDGISSFHWRELGGPPAGEPGTPGYGTRYLRAALGGLFGNPPELHYGADGFSLSVAGSPESLFAPGNLQGTDIVQAVTRTPQADE